MKIYFTASVRGKDELIENYIKIYNLITELGHTNIDDLVLRIGSDELYNSTNAKIKEIYEETVKNIKEADLIILEVSQHSLSMGYVMQRGLELNKPVILLYTSTHLPLFASTIENEKLQVIEYSIDTIKEILQSAIEFAQSVADTRFNFFVSSKHINYLDWIAKNYKIPRSVYLRRLIEKDIDLNDDYVV